MRLIKFTLILLVIYIASYAVFRTVNAEVWSEDGRKYVIFTEGNSTLYYVYRPLSYLDAMLTGTGAHIGPHQ